MCVPCFELWTRFDTLKSLPWLHGDIHQSSGHVNFAGGRDMEGEWLTALAVLLAPALGYWVKHVLSRRSDT
jgi:hypothetical protein